MNPFNEIMRSLGRIEGQLQEICKLPERVHRLEQCQARLKGAWAALAAALAALWKSGYPK